MPRNDDPCAPMQELFEGAQTAIWGLRTKGLLVVEIEAYQHSTVLNVKVRQCIKRARRHPNGLHTAKEAAGKGIRALPAGPAGLTRVAQGCVVGQTPRDQL